MNKKEKELLSEFLSLAAEEFSNHGCNDVDESFYKEWTEEEIEEFNFKLNMENGIEDIRDDQYVEDAYLFDWWVMGYFRDLLKEEAK